MSTMFNEICINEEMLQKYTYIYIYIYIYIYNGESNDFQYFGMSYYITSILLVQAVPGNHCG